MHIAYFTERPYQDPQSGYFGASGRAIVDLEESNASYNPRVAADLYNRYIDEKVYAEEVGFDGLILNEHHSTPFCMGSVVNVEASILARVTQRAKIILLGNILPLWDDPLWLAETLAEVDMISRGRLVPGWVRGTGREQFTHNIPPPYNWERFQEAHDLIIKTWSSAGPFRWEGEHFQYRYVNPWTRPYQQPHPPIWIPGVVSKNTVKWAAERRYPYVMLATDLEPTRDSFAYYDEVAGENGYEAGPQHRAYLFKLHVDETDELAEEAGRRFIAGPSNPFLEGNQGSVRPHIQNAPGLTSGSGLLPTVEVFAARFSRGREERARETASPRENTATNLGTYEDQIERMSIVCGTPDSVLPRIRQIMEYLRPGTLAFWDGDGAMTHEDAMRSLRLMGSDVLPAIREYAKELDLPSPFELDPSTNQPLAVAAPRA